MNNSIAKNLYSFFLSNNYSSQRHLNEPIKFISQIFKIMPINANFVYKVVSYVVQLEVDG